MKKILFLVLFFTLLTAACVTVQAPPVSQPGPAGTPATAPTSDDGNNAPDTSGTTPDLSGVPDTSPGLGGSPTRDQGTGCPADHFVEVQPNAANDEYPAPSLSVSCDGTHLIVKTNDIPDFEFVPETPNALTAQDFTFRIPLTPQMAASPSDVPLLGPIAVSVNGLLIFGPTENEQDGYRDPYLDGILDYCNGHTAPGGIYHFHATPNCIVKNVGGGAFGQIIGYAFDGYPIFAPYICAQGGLSNVPGEVVCSDLTKVESSWEVGDSSKSNAWEMHRYVSGLGDLDECNGLTFADGSYAYFVTEKFPYFLGCYKGVVEKTNTISLSPEDGGPAAGGANPPAPAEPNFAAAAAVLGVSEQQLRDTIGANPNDLSAAAQQLGVSELALRTALGAP